MHPYGQANVMRHQVAQDPINRPQARELSKYQLNRRLCLFVRVFHHLPRRPSHVAYRHRHTQLAARRLGAFSSQPPLV